MSVMNAIVVVSNLPDQAAAERLAKAVIEARVAACVNILAPCVSVFRWKGAIERATEIPVLIKTTADRYAKLEALICAYHPYELPEIIALPIKAGLPDYLAWLVAETSAPLST